MLHTLRIRGFVTVDGFVESLGRHPEALLTSLVENGQVRHIDKRQMYGLLPAGKQLHATLLDGLADGSARAGLAEWYPAFLALNDEFKQLCTDWQVRDDEPNDHSNADYDRRCIDRLRQLAEDARVIIDGFSAAVARMAGYNTRLSLAADCIARGEIKKFTGVMCESFHDIWMELHEDLIVLQRIDRSEEGSF